MAEKKIAPAQPSAAKTEKTDSKTAATRVTKRRNLKKRNRAGADERALSIAILDDIHVVWLGERVHQEQDVPELPVVLVLRFRRRRRALST